MIQIFAALDHCPGVDSLPDADSQDPERDQDKGRIITALHHPWRESRVLLRQVQSLTNFLLLSEITPSTK